MFESDFISTRMQKFSAMTLSASPQPVLWRSPTYITHNSIKHHSPLPGCRRQQRSTFQFFPEDQGGCTSVSGDGRPPPRSPLPPRNKQPLLKGWNTLHDSNLQCSVWSLHFSDVSLSVKSDRDVGAVFWRQAVSFKAWCSSIHRTSAHSPPWRTAMLTKN